jgi:hypothetical protein
MGARELSDAEVFGGTTARPGELSDADVFGGKPAAPAKPKREIPMMENVSRSVATGIDKTLAGINILGGAVPVTLDNVVKALTFGRKDPGLGDAYFKSQVTPLMERAAAIGPQADETTTGVNKYVGMGAGMLPGLVLPMGVGKVAGAAANAGRAGSVVADTVAPAVGFAAPQAAETGASLIDKGVPMPQVAAATGAKFVSGLAQGALPIAGPGKLLGMGGVTAAGAGAIGGAADASAQNMILGDRPDLQQNLTDSGEEGAILGLAMRALLGRGAGMQQQGPGPTRAELGYDLPPGATPSPAVSPANMAAYGSILAANGITDPADPRAARMVAMIEASLGRKPEAVEAQAPTPPEQIPPGREGAPTIAVSGDGKAIPIGPDGKPAVVGDVAGLMAAEAAKARQEADARKAFTSAEQMGERKQTGQDEGTIAAQPRDLRDASPAGTTTPEGTAATKPETFAFLDATRENGQLNGQQVEVLERMTLQDAKGKPVEAARVRMPDGSEDIVQASRVTELSRPANPRFAQAIESGTYAPKKGVGTGPDQPAPREAAQRITTKESPEFIPADRGDGNSTPDPRRGETFENDLPALEGRRQAPPAPDNLLTDNGKRVLANPDTGAPRLPGPERNTPADGRILVDEGGSARRETYGERGDSAEASGREQFIRDYSRNELGNTGIRGNDNAARTTDTQQLAARPDNNAGANGRPGSDGAGNRPNDGTADGKRGTPANDAGARAAPEPAARPADAARAADNVRAEGVDPKAEKRAANGFLKSLWESASKNGRGGIKPSIMREAFGNRVGDVRKRFPMLANNKGHGTDDLVAWAVKGDWLSDADVARLDATKPGGAYEHVLNMLRDAEAGKAPRKPDVVADQRNFEAEKAAFERDETMRYAKDLGIKNPEAMSDMELHREIAEREIDQANDILRAEDNEPDMRPVSEQMRDMGFTEDEIKAHWEREGNDNGKPEAAGDGGGAAAEGKGGGGEARIQDAPGARGQDEKRPDAGPADKPDDGGQRPGFELAGESRADAEQRIERESAAKREAELAAKKADEKAAADKEVDRFELSGSDRAADAPGQGDLAGNSPKPDAVRDATYRLNALPLDAAWDGLKRALRHMVSDDAASGPLRKAIADLFSEAKGMGKREALARSLGALVWSDASVLKSVAEARNSPTLSKVWRMFSDMGGTEKIHGETFEQEVHAHYNRNANETTELLKGLSADQIKQTKALLENRSNIRDGVGGAHKAAKRIAEMLDAERKWLVESGVELGDTKNYVPRVYLAREIAAKAVQFREAATKAYRMMGLDAADAAKAADAWYHATRLKGDGVPEVPFLDLTSGAPQKNFTKTREIPIDVIRKSGLDKFLDNDLSGVLDAYYRRTSKRGAFESRFGGTAEDGSGNAKWNEMRKALDKEGNSDLIDFVENRILSMSGQMKADVSDGVRSAMSLARAVTVATFLRRAVVSSLTEPLQIGSRTASAGAGKATANVLKMYARGANDLVRAMTGLGKSATREDQYRMARMLGTILHENVESGVASLRFDGDTLPNERGTSVSRLGDRISFAAMKASGLHDWTQANTVDSTIIGMDFIKSMAEDAATGRRLANYELDRLGIAEADHAEFSKYAAKVGNADQLLADLRSGNKQASQYVAAIDKFTRQVIMKPTAADKPILAKHPVAQMAYGLQSWMYSYWYNVQKANLNQIKEAATGEGYTKGDRATMAAAPVLYTAAVLAMTGGLLTTMRDLVAGRDRDKEREEKNKKAAIMGVPVETLRVLSQAQLFGLADPFVNSMTSARYNKLPGSELGGPAFGRVQTFGLAKAGVMSDKNSATTNTAERKQAEAFYNLVIDPTLAVGAATLPMPLAAAATFASQRDELRQAYVNQSAGPKKKKETDYTK